MEKGIVYINSLHKMTIVPKQNTTFMLTTRGFRNIDGVQYVVELAPSQSLFSKYLKEWKNQTDENWWPSYYNEYKKGLNQVSAINKLKEIEQLLNSRQNVSLMCFCKHEHICHRSILKEYFEQSGYQTKSI